MFEASAIAESSILSAMGKNCLDFPAAEFLNKEKVRVARQRAESEVSDKALKKMIVYTDT